MTSTTFTRKISAFVLAAAVGAVPVSLPAAAFTLDDIPPISNKNPLHVSLEAGGQADTILPYLQEFAKKTGIEVTAEQMLFASLYSKVNVELQSGTGAYDLVVTETSWTNEWKDFLHPLRELAREYDPAGEAGLDEYLAGHDPGLLRMASTRDGVLMGVPYYTYTMIMIYRRDVLEDPAERANFKERHGYDLRPASSWEELRDQAEFFTRKKGDALKGKPLEKALYALSLMGGRFPHVQDEIAARIWSRGGHFASPVRDRGGKLLGFKVTDRDKDILEWAFRTYQEEMRFAPSDAQNAFWSEATTAFNEGRTVMMPHMYNGLWSWANDVEKIEGAQIAAAPVVGGRPYTGAFTFSPSRDSKNPEGAYWLLKWIGSRAAQKRMIAEGWVGVRRDALTSPEFTSRDNLRNFGWIRPTMSAWEHQYGDVNDYLHFNSAAFGKLYEELTRIGHENAIGKRTPRESVDEWVKTFARIQGKFGELPVLEQ